MGLSRQVINNFVGDSGSGGVKGLVPAPSALDAVKNKILRSDGSWSSNFPGTTPEEGTRAVSTWNVQNASAANQWIDVTYAPELRTFCAIASSGTNRVMLSADGVTWNGYASSEQNLWTSVCWSPELRLFVAVSYDGTNRVMTSSDGQTWTPQSAATQNQWYRVIWAPALGLFIATSLDGTSGTRVMTSPDGINWTSRAESVTAQWYSLTWSPELNLAVAVALGGSVMSSPDGINWTTRTGVGTADWYDISWSPGLGLFAAVAITSGTRIMTSPDGITWTGRSAPVVSAWRRITWAPHIGRFIAVSSNGHIMTSANGITWNQRTSPQANQWYGVAWSVDYKIAVITGITGTNRVLTSTYVHGFLSGGLVGPQGPTGATGATGATGPANPNGDIPTATITQTTPQNTSSGTFVDIPGLSTTITTTTACKIRANFTGTFSKFSGGGSVEADIRVVIDSQNGTTNKTTINGSEFKEASGALLSTQLAAGTYTVKVQWLEGTGSGAVQMDTGVLIALAAQASAPFTTSQSIQYKDDWISPAVTGNLGWTSTVSGTGAANTLVTTNQGSNQSGIVQFSTGTTATGRAALALGASNHFFGGGVATIEMLVRLPTLSTASQEYVVRVGCGDVVTGADMVDGVYFEYDRAVNGVNWRCKTSNNSVRTNTGSGVAVAAGAWIKLKIVINANGTNVDYYIDGTLAASVTTNIPTTVARVSSPTLIISKTVGTTASTMLVDYFEFTQNFTTPR